MIGWHCDLFNFSVHVPSKLTSQFYLFIVLLKYQLVDLAFISPYLDCGDTPSHIYQGPFERLWLLVRFKHKVSI